MIAVGWFYGFFSPAHTVSLAWGVSLLLLFTNWYTVGHGYPPGFLFPLWSISLEEQFYLVWPWMVKYLSPRGLLGIASLLLAAAYLTLALLLGQKQSLDPAIWVNSLVQFQFFALGTMTAVGLRGRVPILPKPLRWGLFFAGLLCLRAAQAAVFANDPSLPHDFAHIAPRFLIALPGCLCLFFSLLPLPAGRMRSPSSTWEKFPTACMSIHVLWLGLSGHLLKISGGHLGPLCLAAMRDGDRASRHHRDRHALLPLPGKPFLRFKKRYTVVRSRP